MSPSGSSVTASAAGQATCCIYYSAAVLLAIYVSVRQPLVLLALGPFVAFAADDLSGFGAVSGGNLSDRSPGDGLGIYLKRRPARERRRSVSRGLAGRYAGIRRGAAGVLRAAFVLAAVFWILDSGDARKGAAVRNRR